MKSANSRRRWSGRCARSGATSSASAQIMEAHRPRLIVLAARGTSDNAAEFGRYLLEITTGIPVSLSAPSMYTLYKARWTSRDALVVAISQSGESTDTNLVLETRAEGQGASRSASPTSPPAPWRAWPSTSSWCARGKERSVAATKTYTGQMLMLYLLAYALGGRFRDGRSAASAGRAEAALEPRTEIAALRRRYRFMRQAVVVGRGLNYANAFEFGLKLMETCYVVAERFSSADFLHGPIAMVEQSFPVFAFAPAGVTWPGNRETDTGPDPKPVRYRICSASCRYSSNGKRNNPSYIFPLFYLASNCPRPRSLMRGRVLRAEGGCKGTRPLLVFFSYFLSLLKENGWDGRKGLS